MKTKNQFHSYALENLLNYCNNSLPYPRHGTDQMIKDLLFLKESLIKDVQMAIETLPPASLRAYGKWLDKRLYEFDVNGYEGSYNPLTGLHSIHCDPKNKVPLLDSNPELQALKYKLAHQCIVVQNKIIEDLDDRIWELHPALKEGRNDQFDQLQETED